MADEKSPEDLAQERLQVIVLKLRYEQQQDLIEEAARLIQRKPRPTSSAKSRRGGTKKKKARGRKSRPG